MVKFAKAEEKPFNPIEQKTINSLAAPSQPTGPPALSETEATPPEPEPEPQKSTPARAKRPPAKHRP